MTKKEFEEKLGREICDQTWYRLNAKLRVFGLQKKVNNGDYNDALILLAEISRRTGKKIDVESFIKVWGLIKSDKKLPENLDGNQLREYILSSLPVKPCSSVFYRWFESAGQPFRASKIYEKNIVIRVVAYAHNWLTKKTPGCKTGHQQPYVTVDLSNYTPFSELISETQGN